MQDDAHIFQWLPPAILSSGTKYHLLEPHLPSIRRMLFNYNIAQIANLSDGAIEKLYLSQMKPLRIPSRPLPRPKPPWTRLMWVRNNADKFQQIQHQYGSVWHFMETNLSKTVFNGAHGCYIHPNDDWLLKCFSQGRFKLDGVGPAICCEFFNNIGIDEFKPDVHTTRLLNRIRLDRTQVRVSLRQDDVRRIGIIIAQTLRKPRACVDSHMWVFCADDKGEVCTEDNPKCRSCWLRIKDPILCDGFPSKSEIVANPVAAAQRFKECNLASKDASRKMKSARLAPERISGIIETVYRRRLAG